MNQKEKYMADIEAKLTSFDETLSEIKAKQELRDWSRVDLNTGQTIRKHDEMHAKVKTLKKVDSDSWEAIKSEIDGLVNDIDKELRTALAYFH